MNLLGDWSTVFASLALLMGLGVYIDALAPANVLSVACMYYFLDTLRALYIQKGVPWQVIHHLGAIFGFVAFLDAKVLLYESALLLAGFELSTFSMNLSDRLTSPQGKQLCHYTFLLSTVSCRIGGSLYLLPRLWRVAGPTAITFSILAVCGIVTHNIAYIRAKQAVSRGAKIDLVALFG
ncbi:Hypothetical protein POVN_LOCUS419 [uncultured virus]|nr:Hypothetical protein POVN_LOCUS419 [uncultured virus]